MNEMRFRKKVLQESDEIREFLGGLLWDPGRGMEDGCYLFFDQAQNPFFSLLLYRSLKIRTV